MGRGRNFCNQFVSTQEIAAEILTEVDVGEELISVKEATKKVINSLYKDLPMLKDVKVRGSIHAYVIESLKRRNTIDFVIELCLKGKSIDELNPFLRNVLRIGVYEMLYHNVHPALATDSTVRIAKKLGYGAASLVNAVMRKAESVDIQKELKKLNPIKKMAIELHHPEWYVKMALRLVGKDAVELMQSNLKDVTYVRVNEIKASIESVRRYLEKHCELSETILPYVFKVEEWDKHPSILEWHEEGKYVVQDLASAIAAHVLSPEPGDFVLDLAAAPGIKTSQLAMLMENRGRIVAVDNSRSRLERMIAKMRQLGVEVVECRLGDGASFKVEEKADKVLLDPPCSTTGAVRKYPCIKWRFNMEKFKSTISLQRKMVENALRAGNSVLYSTCSITFEENEGNMVLFEDCIEKIRCREVNRWRSYGIKKFGRIRFKKWRSVARFWPHIHDCCGFFVALLNSENSKNYDLKNVK
jgi:16S rRNA (cytosine967-C5)-methyltransferase